MKNNIKVNGVAREGGLGQNKQLNKQMQGISMNACFVVPAFMYTYVDTFLFSRVYFNDLRT